jgi:hypothetical protein
MKNIEDYDSWNGVFLVVAIGFPKIPFRISDPWNNVEREPLEVCGNNKNPREEHYE